MSSLTDDDVPFIDHDLDIPFAVCRRNGGKYEDESFVAGYQTGRIAARLEAGRVVGASVVTFMALATIIDQIRIIGQQLGYLTMDMAAVGDDGLWANVVFSTDYPDSGDAEDDDDPGDWLQLTTGE